MVPVCGLEIGAYAYAFAAAGAVLTRNVPAHAFVAGNPARQKGWMCACGERLDAGLVCPSCSTKHEPAADSGLQVTR